MPSQERKESHIFVHFTNSVLPRWGGFSTLDPPQLGLFRKDHGQPKPRQQHIPHPRFKKGGQTEESVLERGEALWPTTLLSSPLHFLFLFPLPSFLNPKRPEDGEKQALGWPDAAPWKKHPCRSAFLHIHRRTSALFLRHLQFLLIGINSRHPNRM